MFVSVGFLIGFGSLRANKCPELVLVQNYVTGEVESWGERVA